MDNIEVIIYTNDGCPRCEVLKEKLESKGIKYTESKDFDRDELSNYGFTVLPVMEFNGVKMDFSDANQWIKER